MIKDIPFEGFKRELENLFPKSENIKKGDVVINNGETSLSQKEVIENIKNFIENKDKNIFILTGGAGTGKTTIIKEIYSYLAKKQKNFQITASTGKATYNISSRIENINGEKISTIFSQLYIKNDTVDINFKDIVFFQTKILYKDIYIIDEAGLIRLKSNKDSNQYQQDVLNFGSGSVLKDIIENLGDKTKIIFVGDLYQLLPIGDNKIFALDKNFYQSLNNNNDKKIYLQQNKFNESFDIKSNLNFEIDTINLNKNYRQENGSGIAINAENVKNGIINKEYFNLIEENNETYIIKDQNLFIAKLKEYYEYKEDNILIAFENKKVHKYNEIIRDEILSYKNIIEIGDKLIISKNIIINDELFFNGEILEVFSINLDIETYKDIYIKDKEKETKKIDLKFLDIDIKKNYGNKEKIFNLKLCLNTLNSGENGSGEDINIFKFISSFFEAEMKKNGWKPKIINKKRFFYKSNEAKENQEILEQENQEYLDERKNNEYYNSLHANYGYAITCHKAQGSEWNNIFLDLDSYSLGKTSENFLRFLYTGITRAKNKVYILNNDEALINESKKYENIASGFGIEKLFIKNYINKIQHILKKYNYFIVGRIDKFDYQIQITFTNGQSDGKIGFYYNGKNKFTKKQSINDTGFNNTIIQILIDNKL